MQSIPMSVPIGDDEIIAALAALRCYIEQGEPDAVPEDAEQRPGYSAWRAAGAAEAQGMSPSRDRIGASWATIERTSRANRWSYGIVGL